MQKDNLIVISGGFDPIHAGHIQYIRHSRKLGEEHDKLLVILNTDEWLTRKKGKPFMKYSERERILKALEFVDIVKKGLDDDGSVCENLKEIQKVYGEHYNIIFANGGDRKDDNVPEVQVCKDLDIIMAWDIGGEKIQSSSDLLKRWKDD